MENDNRQISLFDAFVKLKTAKDVENFLKDLCTPQELKALRERWTVCQLLDKGELSYREINKLTGSSTTTIARVARFLNDEPYRGYKNLLDAIKKEKVEC
ncbi:MAG: transcriptional regulator [Alphaproteobacteria bacterium]|nr:transcriptional regulator [Alphaproteobacteria bacterium]